MKGISKKLTAIIIAAILSLSAFAVCASAYSEDINPDEWYNYYDEWYDYYYDAEYGDDYYDDYYEDENYIYDFIELDGVYYSIDIYEDCSYATVSDFERDDEGRSLLDSKVTIPETISYGEYEVPVTAVSYMAFAECETLTEITLPETITEINDSAFSGAANLTKFELPETAELEYFGSDVFSGTPVLGYLAEQSDDGAVILGKNVLVAYLGNADTYKIPENINIIADYCFFMSGVSEVVFNSNIDYIPAYAFASCRNITEFTVPESVTVVGEGAFSNCANLEVLNLGENLEVLGYKAIENTKIRNIHLGEFVWDVLGAFTGCTTLENITIDENNTCYSFEDDILYYTEEYEDFDGSLVTDRTIEYFLITSDKTSVTVPEDVCAISSYAFYNCKQLEEVVITAPLYISDCAFSYCEFDSFDFSNVYEIGYAAFRGCENLTEADLSYATCINDSAFENCTNLVSVLFAPDLWYVGCRAFANTAFDVIIVTGDCCEIGEAAFTGCADLTYAVLDEGVTAIGSNIFTNCPSLTTVTVPESAEYIDYYAFEGCNDVVFELVEGSASAEIMLEYAEDPENDVTYYEFVEVNLTFFERVVAFFRSIIDTIISFITGLFTPIF